MASLAVATEGEQAKSPRSGASPSTSVASSANPQLSAVGSNPDISAALDDLEWGAAAPCAGEEGMQEEGTKDESAASSAQRRCCCARRGCHLLCASVIATIALVSIPCWPRDPYWKIQKMDIDTTKFAAVMTGAATSDEPLTFTVDVEFFNPNVVPATTEPGSFQVYLGEDVMARGVTDSSSVGARSSSVVHARVSLDTDAAVSQKILAEVMANNFKLKVVAEVQTVARVGPLRVKTLARCEVLSDSLKVLQKPEDVIVNKTCSYSYGL